MPPRRFLSAGNALTEAFVRTTRTQTICPRNATAAVAGNDTFQRGGHATPPGVARRNSRPRGPHAQAPTQPAAGEPVLPRQRDQVLGPNVVTRT